MTNARDLSRAADRFYLFKDLYSISPLPFLFLVGEKTPFLEFSEQDLAAN